MNYKRIVIKIGTNVLTKENGLLDTSVLKAIVDQIHQLKDKGIEVVVVSSGAMGAGRISLKPKEGDTVITRQMLAAVGQVTLMEAYQKALKKYDILCAQVLTTKEDFRSRKHYLNMKNCFDALLADNVIPIVNENDVISVEELMFTDNDELAGLIASMMDVDALLLLTNVDGVFTGHPSDPDTKLVETIELGSKLWEQYLVAEKSEFGRGGMHTKCAMAAKLAKTGITTYIINGKSKDCILDALKGKQIGTTFTAKQTVTSPVKRWIAHSEGTEKGSVTVNNCAKEILQSDKAVSLLPVGITQLDGSFEKGDIIKILDEKGEMIGIGKARYSSAAAKKVLGKQGQKPLVHYDYLYLE